MRRPLAKGRSEFARRFCGAMSECYRRGGDAYTNTAVARSCKVSEKTVREWRLGEKRLPPEAMALLPSMLFEATVAILRSLATGLEERALPKLPDHLDRVERQLAHEDPFEAGKMLAVAEGRIAAMRKAMGER